MKRMVVEHAAGLRSCTTSSPFSLQKLPQVILCHLYSQMMHLTGAYKLQQKKTPTDIYFPCNWMRMCKAWIALCCSMFCIPSVLFFQTSSTWINAMGTKKSPPHFEVRGSTHNWTPRTFFTPLHHPANGSFTKTSAPFFQMPLLDFKLNFCLSFDTSRPECKCGLVKPSIRQPRRLFRTDHQVDMATLLYAITTPVMLQTYLPNLSYIVQPPRFCTSS